MEISASSLIVRIVTIISMYDFTCVIDDREHTASSLLDKVEIHSQKIQTCTVTVSAVTVADPGEFEGFGRTPFVPRYVPYIHK